MPRYCRSTSAPLDAAAAERAAAGAAAGAGKVVTPGAPVRDAPSCFNCGSYGHAIKVGPGRLGHAGSAGREGGACKRAGVGLLCTSGAWRTAGACGSTMVR